MSRLSQLENINALTNLPFCSYNPHNLMISSRFMVSFYTKVRKLVRQQVTYIGVVWYLSHLCFSLTIVGYKYKQ